MVEPRLLTADWLFVYMQLSYLLQFLHIQAAEGENSMLHIIIFDELDAICKQRGSKNDGTGVGDSIVNQLLSKMDGVNQVVLFYFCFTCITFVLRYMYYNAAVE